MREKRLPYSDAEALEEEEEPTKRPRTRFVELQPTADDPADGIDEEIPGSVRADVEPVVLADKPFDPYRPGDPALSASHAASDPGFARAQRALLRQRQQDQSALGEALQAQEQYDQPEEDVNEVGDVMEPFHLHRELEEGYFDPSGTYIEYERGEDQDAWLDSIDEQVQGTGQGTGMKLPYQNEPVAEPPPLGPRELTPYLRHLISLLQPGETVLAAFRRLAGGGPVLDKFGSKEEGRRFFEERVRSGHAVPPGNHHEFQQLTEASEVLFDHGHGKVYTSVREELEQTLAAHLAPEAERAPPEAAPAPQEAAALAAEYGGGTDGGTAKDTAALEGSAVSIAGGGGGGEGGLAGTGRPRHHMPPRAAPAAASEPPVSSGMPSLPATGRTAATTRDGATGSIGVGAAAHGFASELPREVQQEMLAGAPPPQEVEYGLGLPCTSPTALELHHQPVPPVHLAAPRQGFADREDQRGVMREGQVALEAALHGSFGGRLAERQQGPQTAAQRPGSTLPAGSSPGDAVQHHGPHQHTLRQPIPGAGTAAARVAAAVPDERLEEEFQAAARRHRDSVGPAANGSAELGPAGVGGGGTADLAAAGGSAAVVPPGTGFPDRMVQAVDDSSTKALPRQGGGDHGRGQGGPPDKGNTQDESAPNWEELLRPSLLPEPVAELTEDPLAYPQHGSNRNSQQAGASTVPGSAHKPRTAGRLPTGMAKGAAIGGGGGASSGAGNAGGAAFSAAGNVALMVGMVQPAVAGDIQAGAALAGRLDSVERMLDEQEAQEMHHRAGGQGAGRGKQQQQGQGAPVVVAYNNEAANLAPAPMQSAAPELAEQ